MITVTEDQEQRRNLYIIVLVSFTRTSAKLGARKLYHALVSLNKFTRLPKLLCILPLDGQ